MERSLKTTIQAFLLRIGIYHRLKASRLYEFYWRFADKNLVISRKRELEFYRDTLQGLPKGDLIFDIGANVGIKTQLFLQLGSRVVAVEPDPTNQEILRKSFHILRLIKKPVTIVGKAVSDSTGSRTMWVEKPGSAKNTLNPKWVETLRKDPDRFGEKIEFYGKQTVETITMDDLFRSYGRPFYIKIDVEGHEASVLRSMSIAVPFVSFEVNLPQFLPEALQCIGSLERVAKDGRFNYTSNCQLGLALERWLPSDGFVATLQCCRDPSIEVFWRAPDMAEPKEGTSAKER
jgi:FkbM family methyltransferase